MVVSASSVRAGGAYVEVGGNTAKLEAVLMTARGKLQSFAASTATLGKQFLKLGAVMAAPLVVGVKLATDFGDQMAAVGTMLSESDLAEFMPTFRSEMRQLSTEFGEGTDTLSKGLYDILSASIAPARAMDVLRESVMAAKAGMTDTGVAADAITTIINSYGLSADKAGTVSDLLFATVKRGKTTFAELAPAVGMVASTASVAGLSMEEMAAALATGTRNGVRTRISVTALNSTLMTFLKPTTKAAAAAKQFGFELNTNTLRTIGLIGVIKKMQGATAEQIASVFENRRALKLIMPVIQDLEGFTTDLTLAQNRQGLTQEALSRITAELGWKFGQLKQTALDVFRGIGLALAEDVGGALDSVIKKVRSLRDWVNENKEVITGLLKLTATVLTLGATLLAASLAAKMLGFMLSPMGAIAAAIVGLVLVLDYLNLIDTGISDIVGNMKIGGTKIKDIWAIAAVAIELSWMRVVEAVMGGLEEIMGGLSKMMTAMLLSPLLPESVSERLRGARNEVVGLYKEFGILRIKMKLEGAEMAKTLQGMILAEGLKSGIKKFLGTIIGYAKPIAGVAGIPDVGGISAKAGVAGIPAGEGAGIIGTFSGLAASLAAGGPRILEAQLNEQKKSNELLADIKVNTAGGGAATFAD